MSHVLLIVANDEAMLDLVHLVLRCNGCTVFVVRTVEDAAAVAEHHSIDLVVADEEMPARGNADIFVQLKRVAALTRVPFLMISGIGVDGAGRITDGLQPIPLNTFVEEVQAFFAPRRRPSRLHALRGSAPKEPAPQPARRGRGIPKAGEVRSRARVS
jgi:CheY-like chemotaxis protein